MLEVAQSGVDRRNAAAEVVAVRGGVTAHVPGRDAVDPRDQAHAVTRSAVASDIPEPFAGRERHDARAQSGVVRRDRHRLALRVEERTVLARVGDLEDVPLAGGRDEQEVLIPLARER